MISFLVEWIGILMLCGFIAVIFWSMDLMLSFRFSRKLNKVTKNAWAWLPSFATKRLRSDKGEPRMSFGMSPGTAGFMTVIAIPVFFACVFFGMSWTLSTFGWATLLPAGIVIVLKKLR